jgi:SAM-dependent methyltransferase
MRTLWFYLTNEVFGEKNKNRFMWFSPPGYIKFKLKKSSIDCVMPGMGYFDIIQSETAEKLPGGLFDVIIFSHLLEYTSDDTVVLHELRRLLRTGGFVLIQTLVNQHMTHKYPDIITANDRDRLKPYYEPGVRQIYGSDFCKFLIRAGFDVEIIQYAYQLGDGAKKYYRLEDNYRSTIYKCKKTEYNANN